VDQIHHPRRPRQRLTQTTSGRDSRAPRRANDNGAPGATKLPEPQDVDLSELIKTSLLVTGFPRLPNLNLILAEANNQPISPPSSRVIDPTGLDTRDQRAAATERAHPEAQI